MEVFCLIVYTPLPTPVLKFAKDHRSLTDSPSMSWCVPLSQALWALPVTIGRGTLFSVFSPVVVVPIHALPKSEENALIVESKARKGRRL